jgi:hypothetical protein
MTNERKPSIFDDRASIGSEKDLDEYGVWVKSEREDFSVPEGDASFEADFPPFDEEHGSTDTAGRISGTETQTNADVTLSAALFLKIAEELAAIKAELASLKSELDRIHQEKAGPAAAQTSVVPAPSSPKSVASDISTGVEIPENKAGEDISTEAAEDNVVEEAVFDDFGDFGIEESADEEPDEEFVSGEEGEESAHDETAEPVFFDTDEGGDKITLTTDELDLLSESADETPEEMEDSFFAEDSDEEKIAFTSDEIDTVLGNTEIQDKKDDFEGFGEAVQEPMGDLLENPMEEPFDDEESVSQTRVEAGDAGDASDVSQEKPLTEPGAVQKAEEPLVEDAVFDINVETAEEPLSEDSLVTGDAEITLDEESFDIEIDDEPPEPASLSDDLDIKTDADTTEEDELIEPVPETADIVFDPFGSLPDEDSFNEDVLEESAAGLELEEDSPADFTARENPPVEDKEGAEAIEDDPFADFPVLEEPPAEEKAGFPSGEPAVVEESAEAVENDSESADAFAGLPPLEDVEDVLEESAAGLELEEDSPADFTAKENPPVEDKEGVEAIEDDPFAGLPPLEDEKFDEPADIPETGETPEALPEDIFEDGFDLGKDEDTVVEADPALMEILDEDLRQMSPPPDDTSYLDDENPLEFDEFTDQELPAPSEPPPQESALQEAALQEAALQEAAPLPEEKPDAPEAVPQGTESVESPALMGVPAAFKQELRAVLSYMDILLESLPEKKIEEFARSEHFEPYKKLFKELGLV